MSLLERLAPHLPYIRRYARALTGDQRTGDNYVRVALEALAAGEQSLDAKLTPRVALYRVFHAIWCSSGAQLEDAVDEARPKNEDASHRLMRIAPRSRQAFLLTALEGFTPSETAQILETQFEDVQKLISEAQAEIDAELATEVLIIEDEPVIAADIEALVRRVVGIGGAVLLVGLQLGSGGAPDGVEDVIERNAGRQPVVERFLARRQGLERNADIIVAGALVAGECARVAPDVRQMRRKPLKQAHHPSDIANSPPWKRVRHGPGSGWSGKTVEKLRPSGNRRVQSVL